MFTQSPLLTKGEHPLMPEFNIFENAVTQRSHLQVPNSYAQPRGGGRKYNRLDFEKYRKASRGLRRITEEGMLDLLSDPEQDFYVRLAALNKIALDGDPRIANLAPEMVAIEACEATIGIDQEEIDGILGELSDINLEREWLLKETPAFRVKIESFSMSRYLVTNWQFYKFLRANPNEYIPSGWTTGSFDMGKANHPVWSVTYQSATAFCDWLSDCLGRSFRLPTEYEWEYAAAGPDQNAYPWGNEHIHDAANTWETGIFDTSPVGLFPRGVNWCGLYDMGGNVEEWVTDHYHPYPGGSFVEDAFFKMLGDYRVTRGGAFNYLRDLTRCHRRHGMPGYGAFGIRLAETLHPES